jgi:CubicO group peptidase (beta-lactamase class C family)
MMKIAFLPRLRYFLLVTLFLGGWLFFSHQELLAQKVSGLYFPPDPKVSGDWEKVSPVTIGWNEKALQELLDWLPTQDTRAFVVLKDGKIVVEEYWGAKLTGTGGMDQNSYWYWESAGNVITTVLVGIAQQEKLLSITDRTQKFLGEHWTAMPLAKEKKIRLFHHLSFSTGIDDGIKNKEDILSKHLHFLADPGNRWAYHNATYSLLEKALVKAIGQDQEAYFRLKIADPIGMKGIWQRAGQTQSLYSDARSFARFGLLLLAQGNWSGNQLWSGSYFSEMIKPSQKVNKSFGYSFWLNGQESYQLPDNSVIYSGPFIPSGPSDMYMAVGKNGQFLMVVPSENLVIARMGGAPGELPVPYLLLRQFWDRMSEVLD